MHNTKSSAKSIALGGVLAAAAVCIMCLGGLIPVNTYVSPMLCALLLQVILNICGRRIAWAWFFAVAILSLLLCPDREAAGVLLALVAFLRERTFCTWYEAVKAVIPYGAQYKPALGPDGVTPVLQKQLVRHTENKHDNQCYCHNN